MLVRRSVIIIAIIALWMAAIGGCVLNKNLTHEAQYLTALKWYNLNLASYLTHYDAASPETQKVWKVKIDPLFRAANLALETWKASLGTPTAAEKEKLWNSAKASILAMFVTYGIVEIKE